MNEVVKEAEALVAQFMALNLLGAYNADYETRVLLAKRCAMITCDKLIDACPACGMEDSIMVRNSKEFYTLLKNYIDKHYE